jgi:hypothetical protein
VGEFSIKCDMLFFKIGVTPYLNGFLVNSSQNNTYFALQKWKMSLLRKENKKKLK